VLKKTIARVTGRAIFGAILEWSQEETTITAEGMANDILRVIMDGATRLAPRAWSE
jgi:hypothetical protein